MVAYGEREPYQTHQPLYYSRTAKQTNASSWTGYN